MTSKVDEAVYVISGGDNRYSEYLPNKNVTLHYLPAGTDYSRDGWGYSSGKDRGGIRYYCDKPDKRRRAACVWSRAKMHKELGNDNPRICERCWRKYHQEMGLEVPEQPKRDIMGEWEVLPVEELVDTITGKRWLPAKILRRRGAMPIYAKGGDLIYVPYPPSAFMNSDLKKDGSPRVYRWGDAIGTDTGHTAYYARDLEHAASEIRTEIAMLKRRLAEAEAHLKEVYNDNTE